MTSKRDVLFVGFDSAAYERFTQGLSLAYFRTDYISTAPGALELTALLPYDALVVTYPPPGMLMERFLDAIRKEDSTCKHAALVLLAPEALEQEAKAFVGLGVNRVLPITAPADMLQQVLPALIDVAPRISLRALTRLEVPSEFGQSRVLCQTVNVSTSGMLIRIDEDFAPGTVVDFELNVPGDATPICGRAEVVRQTIARKEHLRGVAVRFRGFRGEDGRRFASQLARLAS